MPLYLIRCGERSEKGEGEDAANIPQHRRFFFGNPRANCGITVLQWEGGKYFLHSFNDCAHLSGCR